ncbi:hypothetical protein SAMN04490243_2699 [Robiginitalea myxolifaciens]|uniref:Uncharacterized protein n=1 Tax=Robiginitalea myxolifaciens TaxID=400055 RepID=A0A1I6HG73_9FLAO|nr:hypothetical protein [Robiginitalea myxolifaciens]SFR53354.1 hypothetical protein SAMN04490243_2699 [Robiginitalea myxolifaciens]
MFRNFLKHLGWPNIMLLLVVLSIIIVAEYKFLQGEKLEAIFLGLWAPTILGFMNYLKYRE